MNKKIVVLFILISFLIAGGFFLSFKKLNFLKDNPFLASITDLKSPSVLSENDSLPLKEKIVFLEKKLDESESELEYLDDLTERVDFLNQRVIELEAQFKEVQASIALAEAEREAQEDEEDGENEENEGDEGDEENGEDELVEQIPCQVIAGSSSQRDKIIINEVAWMGTTTSSSDEWMELKNISGGSINLAGWQILDKNQDIKIFFSGEDNISSNGLFILERTDDQTLPNVKADRVYTGILANEDEGLYLFDGNCQLQDRVETGSPWPAGNNSSKRTMERKTDLSWQTSYNPGGTPKFQNSQGYIQIAGIFSSGSGSGDDGSGSGATPPPSYPKILISEIQISPTEERFIELYNPTDSEINLTGWYIQKKTKTATSWASFVTSTQFEGKTIQPKDYLLISRTLENSNILLSTLTLTEDNSLVLKNPNREAVDKVGWGQSPDFETAPFPKNPEIKDPIGDWLSEIGFEGSREPFPSTIFYQSLGRKIISEENNYQDTNNNAEDFEIQTPTPKAKNKTFIEQELEDVLKSITDYYNTPVETKIISGPEQITDQTQAIFEFQTTKEYCHFECRLNEEEWQECNSPKTYENLEEGEYTFSVRAIDLFSNIDPNPSEYLWTIKIPPEEIDTAPPQIVFQLEPIQIFLSFTISFEITDPLDTVTPSGLDRFVFRWREEQGEWQEDEYQEIEGEVDTFEGERQFESEDGKTYYFQIKAQDKAENESDWQPEPPVSTRIEIEQQKENGCLPEQININTALEEDLLEIIHIGPSRAEEIISLRPFSSLDDLVRVNGISEGRLADIKEEDLACIE